MHPHELVERIRKRPFTPLRLHVTGGQTYDIRHPEMVMVLRGRVDIGVGPDAATGIADRVDYCSLLHVVRVEELVTPTTGSASPSS